jgi:hypothetical protein
MKLTTLDPVYFGPRSWAQRIGDWIKLARATGRATPFLQDNLGIIRQILGQRETGPRMVVNIGADELLSFLETDDYKNIYENPVVGGRRRAPSKERVEVDGLLGLGNARRCYFGAVALDGSGVRFYGEYCMVIKPARVEARNTGTFDRDSYDLLQSPLSGRSPTRTRRIVAALRGVWDVDLVDMLIMKMLPELPAAQHLITVGNLSDLVLSDQEFVEVHLEGKIAVADVEEIRQSSNDAVVEATIRDRRRSGQSPTLVEMHWMAQRRRVAARLAKRAVRQRVVLVQARTQWS